MTINPAVIHPLPSSITIQFTCHWQTIIMKSIISTSISGTLLNMWHNVIHTYCCIWKQGHHVHSVCLLHARGKTYKGWVHGWECIESYDEAQGMYTSLCVKKAYNMTLCEEIERENIYFITYYVCIIHAQLTIILTKTVTAPKVYHTVIVIV